ncbi:MAG: SCO family protein [Planctomycetota bacterium]|nr:MAG: SCO family protein [Planctomycetota bacterium]
MTLLLALLFQAASPLEGVGVDQNIGGTVPMDLAFVDEKGTSLTLRDAAAGKAFILAPVYYRCPQLCTLVLNGLLTSLKSAGSRYQVVTFSFDPREDAPLASAKKAAYLSRYDQPGSEQTWRFLTGRQESIDALCRAVGFRTSYNERTGQYAHPSALIIVAPDGRISRYFFGIEYPTRDLRLAIAEASAGKTGSIVDPVLLFCFQYDPATGRYGLAVLRLLRAGGLVTAVIVGIVIVRLARRHRRTRIVPSG